MVHLTVGVGGNYSGWVACYNYLSGLGALADDYEIEQISNITITNWPSILTTIRLNGHYVRFYVAWENSHQGNPTRGYVTSLNGVNGVFRPYNSSLSLTGSFILENLYFRQITNTANMLVEPSSAISINHNINIYIDNLLIEGFAAGALNIYGIGLRSSQDNYRVRNVKIWNCRDGIYITYSGWAAVNRNRIFENLTIWSCSEFCYFISGLSNLTVFNNSYGCGCLGVPGFSDWNGGFGAARTILNNCADSDNSIVTQVNAQKNNCIANVNEATQLLSLNDANANFLRISPASQLYSFGTLVITNTSSIEGYPRPNLFGVCSIGASEPNVAVDFVGNPLNVAIQDTVSFTPIYDEAIIVAFHWNLDDGKGADIENCNVKYDVEGYKTISLAVIDNVGYSATVVKLNYVYVRGYQISFIGKPVSGPAPLKVKFTHSFEPEP